MEELYRNNIIGVIINTEGKVLVAQYSSSWSRTFPKWWLEKWETKEAGILREIEEELGIKPNNLKIIAEYKEQYKKMFTEEEIARKKENKGESYIGKKESIFLIKYYWDNTDITISVSDELKQYARINLRELTEYIKYQELLAIIDITMLENFILKLNIL